MDLLEEAVTEDYDLTLEWAPSSMDSFLAGDPEDELAEEFAEPEWISGQRVAFNPEEGSLLAYDQAPEPGAQGVVVRVRTSSGDLTSHGGKVFVRWAGGELNPVWSEHLEIVQGRTANNYRRVVRSMDLGEFLRVASSDDLVHKATRDLWSMKEEDGEFVIERLFDETGRPLKV